MLRFVLRRLVLSAFVLVGVMIVVFMIVRLSGDPTGLMISQDASADDVAKLRHEMGFDRPLLTQFLDFAAGAVRGDFGDSLRYREPAFSLVAERLGATLRLAAAALTVAVCVAIPAGIVSAVKRNTIWDRLAMFLALFGQSMPVFWFGILLILIVSVRLQWLPSSGDNGWKSIILPAITLGLYSTARITRLVRSEMIDTISQDYVRTARAKGLRERVVLYRHALRNALIPVITVIGIEAGSMLGGAVITETVFAWPGIGQLAVRAIFNRDYPLVQAIVFTIACTFVLINLIVDLLYAVLDPRVKQG
jgi:ABC-type dipeptide/oligopeptide/nickel transport system permease component